MNHKYVIKKARDGNMFYIGLNEETLSLDRTTSYVHKNGKVRGSTRHNRIFTGYFKSRKKAEKALRKYEKRLAKERKQYDKD